MANTKITDLTDITTPALDDVLEIVDISGNVSRKVQVSALGATKENIGLQSSVSWTGAQVIDWDNVVVKITLTGNVTLTETNLPITPNTKIIERWIKGNFTLTLPVGWTAQKGNDTYDGLVMNRLIIECTNLSGTENIVYTLKNMTV